MESLRFHCRALYQAITAPISPLKPGLPNIFMISLRYKAHEEALKKYLDILPRPFTWRFETEEESRNVAAGLSDLNEQGIAIYRSRSETFKRLGNDAFKKKDRKAAVAAYTQAIDELEEALGLAQLELDDEAKADAKKALAVCYANRAAAWTIDGPGSDAGKAVEDGYASERMNKTYLKSCDFLAVSLGSGLIFGLDITARRKLLCPWNRKPKLRRS
jgi:hypothetical protein